MKLFTYLIIAVVAVSIIAGFFILGTPQAERMRRFDDTRVGDLQNLQYQIIGYWQNKGKLPESLDALVDQTQGTRPPVDPETAAAYEYKIIRDKKLTFELCANFSTENVSAGSENPIDVTRPAPVYGPKGGEPVEWNWQHKIGQTCFERTIDPDFFPILKTKGID